MRYLVIADNEGALDPLVRKVVEIAAGDAGAAFDLLVPLGQRSHSPEDLADADGLAWGHLQDLQERLRDQGISAEGQVSGDRLSWTIEETLASADYDAIIVSTPRQLIREAARLDLTSHVRRTFGLPVIRVGAPRTRRHPPPPAER